MTNKTLFPSKIFNIDIFQIVNIARLQYHLVKVLSRPARIFSSVKLVLARGKKFLFETKYREIPLKRTHHKADTLYKADKEFAPNLEFSGQILLKVISIKRTLP